MDWKLHIIIPLIVYGILMTVFSFSLIFGIAALIVIFFSSLLPDLDYPKSFIRMTVLSVLFFLSMWFVVIYVSTGLPVKILIIAIIFTLFYAGYHKLPLNHRGPRSLHQWRLAIIFPGVFLMLCLISGIDLLLAAFFFLGYSIHLLLDKIKKF